MSSLLYHQYHWKPRRQLKKKRPKKRKPNSRKKGRKRKEKASLLLKLSREYQ
jgi:hypothetical protein